MTALWDLIFWIIAFAVLFVVFRTLQKRRNKSDDKD